MPGFEILIGCSLSLMTSRHRRRLRRAELVDTAERRLVER
jgi:hypothetical protein